MFSLIYVSRPSEVRGDGFHRQFIAIRQYCAAHQLHIVGIFKERGICGATELDNRPALSELFNALETDGVKAVVIEKLDRLARDLMVQETIVADMQKSGYVLHSSCEPDLCSIDPSRVLVRQIFGAIAQYEKCMIVLKLRGARQRKKARGERGEGRHAFGEKPGEEIVLQKMLALQSSGETTRKIAASLNAADVSTRMGGAWNPGTVAKYHQTGSAKQLKQTNFAPW